MVAHLNVILLCLEIDVSILERYIEIASKLSFLSKERRFDIKDTFEIVLDSGEKVKIGPFVEGNDGGFIEVVCWQENPTDEFFVYMDSENWDSWGSMYDDHGNNFSIAKIVKFVPVIDPYWEVDYKISTPPRNRW